MLTANRFVKCEVNRKALVIQEEERRKPKEKDD